MLQTVYIESSVISYLTARSSRDIVVMARQTITESWWHYHRSRFDVFVSGLVIQEISKGDSLAANRRLEAIADIPLLQTTDQAVTLAESLLTHAAIPANSVEDALHIGIAAAGGVDFLLTWNFKHINNVQTKTAISEIIESHGFVCPQLCSPEELGVEI